MNPPAVPDAPSFASADPAAAHQAHIAAVLDARAGDADALRAAADELDAVWAREGPPYRAVRDAHDRLDFQRVSLPPRLRAMADKIDPPGADD